MNCFASNCITYHEISDKIAVTINCYSTIQNWAPSNLENLAAFIIMQLCAFSMQIGNYRANAKIPRTEFSTKDQDEKNNTEETIVL